MTKIFEVFWADPAVRDLDDIADFLAEEAPAAADRLFEKIATKAATLEGQPLRGRIVPELARLDVTTYRELILPPYRLIDRVEGKRVLVVALFDARRDLADVLVARRIRS